MSDDKPDLSFEEALEKLRQIVTKLEQGDGKLDEALEAYETGAKLKAICEARLNEAKERIEQITIGANGEANTKPFDS